MTTSTARIRYFSSRPTTSRTGVSSEIGMTFTVMCPYPAWTLPPLLRSHVATLAGRPDMTFDRASIDLDQLPTDLHILDSRDNAYPGRLRPAHRVGAGFALSISTRPPGDITEAGSLPVAGDTTGCNR